MNKTRTITMNFAAFLASLLLSAIAIFMLAGNAATINYEQSNGLVIVYALSSGFSSIFGGSFTMSANGESAMITDVSVNVVGLLAWLFILLGYLALLLSRLAAIKLKAKTAMPYAASAILTLIGGIMMFCTRYGVAKGLTDAAIAAAGYTRQDYTDANYSALINSVLDDITLGYGFITSGIFAVLSSFCAACLFFLSHNSMTVVIYKDSYSKSSVKKECKSAKPVPTNEGELAAEKEKSELIKRYSELLRSGAITEEEYEKKKKTLLSDGGEADS